MQIILDDADVKMLEFRIEQTSDRQDQPERLVDRSSYPKVLDSDTYWQYFRWDMFYVDVLLSASHSRIGVRLETDGVLRYPADGSTWLRLERIFIDPTLSCPMRFTFNRQTGAATPETDALIVKAVEEWFVEQPEYLEQVRWLLTAMRKMREILVLSDKFDPDWWTEFQENSLLAEAMLIEKEKNR